MVSNSQEQPVAAPADLGRGSIRVAVICDYLEEKWPSMDLTAAMLYRYLVKNHAPEIAATELRPPFRRRLTFLPMFRQGAGRNIDRLANRFLDYPRWLRAQVSGFDLFHLADHSYSQLVLELPPGRAIVTCHDLDTFRCILEPEQEKRPAWFQAMARRILQGFQQAAHVICNSTATRDHLLHYGLIPPEKLTVIHVGVHPAFTSPADPLAETEAIRLIGPNSGQEIRLLSVGSTIPRKRMDILLRVFRAVRDEFPTARLIRIGGPFTEAQHELARELGVEAFISLLPFVSSEVLAAIYRQSALLLLPSEAEGFGMPLTEALACGCPVLASDLPVLREVGGAVCEYCGVGDVDAWAQAAVRMIQENASGPRDFEHWSERARAHASRYSWAENARQTVLLYEKVLQKAARG